MKNLLSIIFFVAMAVVAVAQTPREIVSRMEAELSKHNENEGVAMTVDVKVAILGSATTRIYYLGNKIRLEGSAAGKEIVTWKDGATEWTYNLENNEIDITNAKYSEKPETQGDMTLFSGITDGYDVTINNETDTEWYLRCKRSKSNSKKEAPKKMDLVVAKGTYWPASLKVYLTGIDMTMREISFGVTEQQVTFDAKEFPNATIVDKRQ